MNKIIFILSLAVSLFGVQAFQGDGEFIQGDKTQFSGQLKGDEWFSWVQTQDGYVSKYNSATKNYEYMILEDGELIFSDVKVNSRMKNINSNNRAPSLNQPAVPSGIQKIPASKIGEIWKKSFQRNRNQPLMK